MKNFILSIDPKEVEESALNKFYGICHFERLDDETKEEMIDLTLDINKQLKKVIDIKCLFSAYDGDKIIGNEMIINENILKCEAFTQINEGDINKAYIYMLTIGECFSDEYNEDDFYYLDSLETAYVDAVREYLNDYIKNISDDFASNSFGPGYYGMGIDELKKFFDILDAQKINLKFNERLMVPKKSCAGIYFTLKNTFSIKNIECESCIGNERGCLYCSVMKDK